MKREGTVERTTKETTIKVKWVIDGEGLYTVNTGIPFFDHMLHLFSRHGFFDLDVWAKGDIEVDCHHTVEDMGITMGKALRKALPELEGISRYGHSIVPMDESLCMVAIDMGGRPNFVWRGDIRGVTGNFDTELVKEFFKGFVNEARMSLHIDLLYGENLHHKVEAVFKAFARALRDALSRDDKVKGVLSTKGIL